MVWKSIQNKTKKKEMDLSILNALFRLPCKALDPGNNSIEMDLLEIDMVKSCTNELKPFFSWTDPKLKQKWKTVFGQRR